MLLICRILTKNNQSFTFDFSFHKYLNFKVIFKVRQYATVKRKMCQSICKRSSLQKNITFLNLILIEIRKQLWNEITLSNCILEIMISVSLNSTKHLTHSTILLCMQCKSIILNHIIIHYNDIVINSIWFYIINTHLLK